MRALDDVSLAIRPGEIHCLAGENGSGKSTIIKIISGVVRPDQGELWFDGRPVAHQTPMGAMAGGVQVIFQDFSLFPNLTVAENLALSGELRERRRLVDWHRVRRVAREAVARLGVALDLDADLASLPTSGRQLVAIARALMSDARLIIMDEPTTALTGREVQALFGIVRDIQARGIAVLFVSHKMREMLEISERITVIRNGRLVAEGPTEQFDAGSITRAMTGQEIGDERYEWAGGPPRLRVAGLTVPGQIEDVTLKVAAGEIVGVAGLLGSGRTALALALFGMHSEHSGEIWIDDAPVRLRNVQQAVAHGVAYVPENRLTEGLFLGQTINRNLIASSLARVAPHGWLDRRLAGRAAAAMIAQMQIATPTGERPVLELSGGNQQRVLIGRWLMIEAKVLILNGPTVGVDVGSKAGIHRRIRELAQARGLAVLMISDDEPELVQHCNRVLVMHRGRIVDDLLATTLDETSLGERLKALA